MIRTQQDRLLWEMVKKGEEIDFYDLKKIFPRLKTRQSRNNHAERLVSRNLVIKRVENFKKKPYRLSKYKLNPDKAFRIKRFFEEELQKTGYKVPESKRSLSFEKLKFGEILPYGIK